MFKPKKHFGTNQRNCLGNLLHQPLVERVQSTMVHQLSRINQMLCTWTSKNFIQGGGSCRFLQIKPRIFVGEPGKNGELPFFLLETKQTTFLLKI